MVQSALQGQCVEGASDGTAMSIMPDWTRRASRLPIAFATNCPSRWSALLACRGVRALPRACALCCALCVVRCVRASC
eukprot:3292923-Pyramimonas_sp.AAC.1